MMRCITRCCVELPVTIAPMSEMLSPLQWVPPEIGLTAAAAAASTKMPHPPFCWPVPPFADYPEATPQMRPEPCEVIGLNDGRQAGRLIFFVPDQSVVHLQLPPARTTMALRFTQFKTLALVTPLQPLARRAGDAARLMLGAPLRSRYRVQLREVAAGTTEWLSYDKLLLAPGALPLRPNLPGIDDPRLFTLRSLQDMVFAQDSGARGAVARHTRQTTRPRPLVLQPPAGLRPTLASGIQPWRPD